GFGTRALHQGFSTRALVPEASAQGRQHQGRQHRGASTRAPATPSTGRQHQGSPARPGTSTRGASTPGRQRQHRGASTRGRQHQGRAAQTRPARAPGAPAPGAQHQASSKGRPAPGASTRGASTRGASTRGASSTKGRSKGASTRGASTRGASTGAPATRGASTRAPAHRAASRASQQGRQHQGPAPAHQGRQHQGRQHQGRSTRGASTRAPAPGRQHQGARQEGPPAPGATAPLKKTQCTCLLLVIGLVATVNELQLQTNATLMKNETAVQRVRAGTLDYGINCSVSRYIIFTSGEEPTLVAWEVAPDDGGTGSGSCHVYLPDRAGASDRNCARMSEQLGIRLADADRPETGLKIGLVNASHGGWYQCRVYIDNLLYIGHTRLLVEEKPSAPTDLRLTPLSPDTLVASWSPPGSNGNLPVLRYELTGSGLRLSGSPKPKLLINNLGPHKVYCLSVLAVNAAGRGPSTESVCNRTLEGSPEPGALRVELHSVNDTIAVLRFHIDLDKMAGQFRQVSLKPRLLWHLESPGRLSAGSQAQKNIVIAAEEFNNSIVTTRALTDLEPYSHYRLLYSVSNGAASGSAGSIDFNTTEG
uniref:Fibronectin type-III domain-containing protein n=1 Tax=Macrostomum lignano TaxID=282301 RepID=A0A1I8FTM5_9PLAT